MPVEHRGQDVPRILLLPPSCCGVGYFRPLGKELTRRGIATRTVELPMHGRRWREDPLVDAHAAVADITAQVGLHEVDLVYGESMGAYLGLLLMNGAEPTRTAPPLVAASNRPPVDRVDINVAAVTSLETAQRAFADLGGEVPVGIVNLAATPERTFALLRGDIALSQSLIEATRPLRTIGPITVVRGTEDTSAGDLSRWSLHATGDVSVHHVRGGHLISSANPSEIADIVVTTLRFHHRDSGAA